MNGGRRHTPGSRRSSRRSARLPRSAPTPIAHNRGPRDNDKFIYAFKGANVERSHARRKRDAEQRLDRAEQSQVRKPRPPLAFAATLTDEAVPGRVVLARDLEVAGRLRLDRLDVAAGQHLLVSGGNGTGKSTLLVCWPVGWLRTAERSR